MNYSEWSAAYQMDACRIQRVIEKKKKLLNDKSLNADVRKSINDTISAYRMIYRELLKTAELLMKRGRQAHEA